MPEAPIETAPAEVIETVVPAGTDQPDVVPENVRKLMGNLFADPEAPKEEPAPKPEEAPKAEEKDKKDPKVETQKETKPEAPSPEPGIKLRKPKVVRPELPIVQPEKPQPVAKEEPYKPDPQWESGLQETEREMLKDAREAEENFPDKHAGLAARTAKFLKEHAELTAKEDFDDQSPQYKAWLEKNQPRLSREQVRELEEVRVTSRVRKEYDTKLHDLQHKIFVREHEPKIEQEGKTVFAELSHSSLPDEVAKAIKEEGFDKAAATYGLEIETAQNVLAAAVEDIIEFRRITMKDPETGRPLQPVVEDPSHPKFAQHQRLSKMVDDICGSYAKAAYAQGADGSLAIRDGKYYVTRDEWRMMEKAIEDGRMPPERLRGYWTFKNSELIDAAKKNMKAVVGQAIEQKRGYITKLGFTRAPKAEAPKPQLKAEPPIPTNTPRTPAPAPVPGATDAMSEIDARAARMAAQLGRG